MCEVYNERGQMYYVHTTSWRGFTWTGREGLVCMHNTLLLKMLIKIRPDATVCRYLYTVKSLYMFQVPQHPSSGVLKFVTAASGTGHNTGTATSLQRGLIGTGLCESCGKNTYLPTTRLAQTSPNQATLEGSSCTSIMTCTGGCGYRF